MRSAAVSRGLHAIPVDWLPYSHVRDTASPHHFAVKKQTASAFARADKDGNGRLSQEEVHTAFRSLSLRRDVDSKST